MLLGTFIVCCTLLNNTVFTVFPRTLEKISSNFLKKYIEIVTFSRSDADELYLCFIYIYIYLVLISFTGFNSPEWFLSDIGAIFAGGKVKTKEFYDFIMIRIILKNKGILDSARSGRLFFHIV